MIDQIPEGLQTGGVFHTLKDNHEECSALFCGGKVKLTAFTLAELLEPSYQRPGSNTREIEECIMFNLEMLLQKAQSGGELGDSLLCSILHVQYTYILYVYIVYCILHVYIHTYIVPYIFY